MTDLPGINPSKGSKIRRMEYPEPLPDLSPFIEGPDTLKVGEAATYRVMDINSHGKEAKIVWTITDPNGKVTKARTSSYLLKPEIAGQYLLRATVTVGEDSTSAYLDVQVYPKDTGK